MYNLSVWQKPGSDEIRIYIQGTTRSGVYFTPGADGTVKWSSKANDTPHRFQTGDHYGKVRKDRAAASEAAAAFGIVLGETTFAAALEIARSGIGATRKDDGDDE